MFERTLSDRLEKVLDNDDRHAVLAYLASEQLSELAAKKIQTQRDTLMAYYHPTSENYETLKRFVAEDTKNKHPVLYCLFALVTDDIATLDLVKLEYAKQWLNEVCVADHAELKSFHRSLEAIGAVLNYDLGEAISLPENCYLNFAGARLPQANLSNAMLAFANFNNANLEEANLEKADLFGALLNNVNARKANLTHAHMPQVQTDNSSFESATLCHANLQNVMLEGSFKGANLTNADLRFAKLCSRTLDLKEANLAMAIMNRTTQFLYMKGNASTERYEAYKMQKKAMLSQVCFFTDNQLSSSQDLDEALLKLFLKLESNRDFSFMQQCIGHQLIITIQQLIENCPELADQLRETAYTNIFFETDNFFATAPNLIARSLFSLFANNNEIPVDVIESDAQKQMRTALNWR